MLRSNKHGTGAVDTTMVHTKGADVSPKLNADVLSPQGPNVLQSFTSEVPQAIWI